MTAQPSHTPAPVGQQARPTRVARGALLSTTGTACSGLDCARGN